MTFEQAESTTGAPSKDERTWAMFAHFGGPIGMLATGGALGFLIPLVVYLARRDDSKFASEQAKEAMNWQITLFLLIVGGVLACLLTLGIALVFLVPMFLVLWILALVLGVVGGLQAYEGKSFRYPFSVRFIS